MRGRYIHIGLLLFFICTAQLKPQVTSNWNADTTFYFYFPDSNAEHLVATSVIFNDKLNNKKILDSIAAYLSNTYFVPKYKYYNNKVKIKIRIQDITIINTPNKNYSIATVNIEDPAKICMGIYFQGSTGGYNTFLMLVANLMQPQLEYPLLDAVIFLYNSEELEQMDHINLKGIISEREIDNLVRRMIKN